MIRRALASLVLCLILLCAGIYLGGHPSALPGFLRDPLVGDQDTRVVNEAIDTVNDTYYRKIPKKDLANKAIAGIVSSLDDRFSNYFDPKSYAKFQLQQSGEFAGIGVQVTHADGGLRIVEVYDGSPAKRAKLARRRRHRRGQRPVACRDKSSDAAVALIQGHIGTDVKLTVSRDGKRRDVTLQRDDDLGPRGHVVDADDQGQEVRRGPPRPVLLRRARRARRRAAQGDEGRGQGRRLRPARATRAAWSPRRSWSPAPFLSDGKIVTTKGRSVPSKTLSAVGDPVAPKTPLVVLVDRNSASAAEIVAGALQDRKRATLVGTRTFGKGVFQEVLELSNGGALDITAGQYFLPSGRNLGGAGVSTGSGLTPDVAAADDPKTPKVDEGLDKALDVLAAKA